MTNSDMGIAKAWARPSKQVVACGCGKARSWRLEERFALGWGQNWDRRLEWWEDYSAKLIVRIVEGVKVARDVISCR